MSGFESILERPEIPAPRLALAPIEASPGAHAGSRTASSPPRSVTVPWRGPDQGYLCVSPLPSVRSPSPISVPSRAGLSNAISPIPISSKPSPLTNASSSTPGSSGAQPTGGLARVTRLSYDKRGNLDKVRILLNIARAFRKAEQQCPPHRRPLLYLKPRTCVGRRGATGIAQSRCYTRASCARKNTLHPLPSDPLDHLTT